MTAATQLNDLAAHEAMRRAHDAGYRFPPDFAGFSAKVQVLFDGQQASGTMAIRSPQDVELDIELSEEGKSWLQREISSIAGHRWHLPYEEADGRHTLSFGDDADHPLGRTVTVHDDRFGSWYRVDDAGISQVNRGMGKMRFSIQIQERKELPDGRQLPAHFSVHYWDLEEGRLTGTDVYRDKFVEVDGVQLPVERRISQARDEDINVRTFVLTDHTLLSAEG